jgi:hypothetical protein
MVLGLYLVALLLPKVLASLDSVMHHTILAYRVTQVILAQLVN